MRPHVDPITLQRNPQFEALCNDLSKTKLNLDGSSQLEIKAIKEVDDRQQALQEARIHAAERELLGLHLTELSKDTGSNSNLHGDEVKIAIAVLTGQIPLDDLDLVKGDIEKFKARLEGIAPKVAERLHNDATALKEVTSNFSENAGLATSDLILLVKKTLLDNQDATTQLQVERTRITSELHSLHSQITEACIRVLEQIIHGSVSRSTKAEADYLASVAEGMSKKLSMQHRQLAMQIDSDQARAILLARIRAMQEQYSELRKEVQAKEGTLSKLQHNYEPELVEQYVAIMKEQKRIDEERA